MRLENLLRRQYAVNDPANAMKTSAKHIGAAILAAVAVCTLLSAQTTPQATSPPPISPKKSLKQFLRGQLVPYHGMISAVDKNTKTFAITGKRESRTFKITDATSITKDGETISIDDIKPNDEVSGSYLKTGAGTLEVRTIKIGPVKRKATPTPTASPIR
jgi:hypothetical protein